jgi:hypothetical protein
MMTGIVDMLVLPLFTVTGDAAATSRNILASELTYRLGILFDIVAGVIFILVAVSLYWLLKEVDKWHAMLMVLLASVGITIGFVNIFDEFVPLILLSGAGYLSAFSQAQLEALAMSFLRLNGDGNSIAMVFWGLWLFPFGILVMRSGFFPRVLGILLMVAGLAYVTMSLTSIVAPDYKQTVSQFMMPLYFGEVPIILYLLIKGARVVRTQVVTAEVS